MSNTVLSVENISKLYKLGSFGHGTFYADIQSWWARARGKEDPNEKLKEDIIWQPNRSTEEKSDFWALKDISFQINEGDVLGVIGHNGAGKSTLLKIISRITTPTHGTIKIKGRVNSLLEVGTGFHPELSGRENIYLNGTILGMTKKEIDNKFDEIVDFSEVQKFIDTPVKRYSSGMYVRLAFAVAAHLEPEILIIDEVLAVGDTAFQKKCLGKMNAVSKQGRTVLFVSHNLAMIRTLCNKCLLLKKGQVVENGNIANVVDTYIKSIAKNKNAGKVVEFKEDTKLAAQILKAGIIGEDGEPKQIYDVYDNIYFYTEYCFREPLEGIAFNLIVERNGEPLFVSFDTDTRPELLNSRIIGKYRSKVPLPWPLKAGHYTINISLGKLNVGGIDVHREIIEFDIEEISFDSSKRSLSSTRPGVMGTNLIWEIEAQDNERYLY